MTQSYLCTPLAISDDLFDTFLFLEGESPCSLTLGDLLTPSPEDFAAKRFFPSSAAAVTDQPHRWAEVLFDPEDIMEIRLRPARPDEEKMRPRRLWATKTANEYGIDLFPFACGINALVNRLRELNAGGVTWWGEKDENSAWADDSGEVGHPLNIYAGVNPRFASGCTTNEDVICARCLVADLDKTTLADALAKLKASGLPQPSMIVLSGHGVHFYWRLTKPVTNLARWTAIQKRLIRLLDSDHAIHDPARVMRVPGFLNVNGNTPVPCTIHEADAERRYELNDLLRFLPPSPPEPPKPDSPARILPCTDSRPQIASDTSILKRAAAYAAQFEPVEENRNSTLFGRVCDLTEKFDLTEAEILPLIETNNDKASNPLDADELKEVVSKAVKHVAKKGKQRGTLAQPPIRIEKYAEPTGPVIDLQVWRDEMKKARLESVGQTGKVFFDGSTTGAGKSTADIAAMKEKKIEGSATFVPTHDACGDLVKRLKKEGLTAAAHPKMDEDSCQKYGTDKNHGPARKALNAGLNVGMCICPTCEFKTTCKWQKEREEARNAVHVIATHRRAELSGFTPAKEKQIVFIHEDPLNLLRPLAKVVKSSKKKGVPQLGDLHDFLLIAQAAEQVAIEWGDDDARRFAQRLHRSAQELVTILTSPELVQPHEDAAAKGKATKKLPVAKSLTLKTRFHRHKNLDLLLKKAMDRSGILAKGDVLRLVVGYACGELHQLCAVVDEHHEQKKKSVFTKGILAVWKTELPTDAVIWFEDASSTAPFLKELVGKEVLDKTPNGRLDFTRRPIQYVSCFKDDGTTAKLDVTKTQCLKEFRGIVRGVLALYPLAKKIGIITHRKHAAEISNMAPLWRNRISKVEYFNSGKDRASNEWLDCDLILVIGTPRVPPSSVRDALIRLGRQQDAEFDGGFSSLKWEGKTVDGNVIAVEGLGYAHPSWNELHSHLVKETLRQAVGRGRAVTEKAVQVVVASNESIGIPLASQPLLPVSDSEDDTLHLTLKLTDVNSITTTIEKMSVAPVKTKDVAGIHRIGEREIRRHFISLISTGLLKKKGARSGVTVPEWLLGHYSQSRQGDTPDAESAAIKPCRS